MKICFPIQDDRSLDSEVYGHFGSAPAFILVDTVSGEFSIIVNADQHHSHGTCSPFRALGGRAIDCVVVGGIGGGALNKLSQAGIRVFKASARTVRVVNPRSVRPEEAASLCGRLEGRRLFRLPSR